MGSGVTRARCPGKDLTWWNRGKLNTVDALKAEGEREAELKRVKEEEEQLLLEAL